MHINLLLPFLLLSSPFALSKPAHGKRSTHLEKNFNPLRRIQEPLVKIKRKNGKRVLKKKKRACQVPVTANVTLGTGSSTSASSYPASSSIASIANASSIIGGNNWATPSSASAASASASASASIASAAASASASATTNSNSDWNLVETVSGSNFFDAWNFWSYDDPTHGTVDYVDSTTAWNENLISINNAGNAIMTVDTTEQVSNGRKAVRIHANRIWTGGLVLMDAVHMPTGCGTWPAWWMNGPNWPNGGEIDILEGVNAFSENQVSLHTGDGCTMPSSLNSGQTGQLTTGSYDSYNCASYATSNQGCGVRAVGDESSYGPGFNSIGGGVYALKWDKTGITAWFFPRSSIPSDISSSQPDPSSWPTPMAHFPSDSCDPYTYFYDNFNIFTNTFCGDWAGADGVWNYAGYAGQSESCASITGYSTCSDYVLNKGSGFTEAYWEVSYVKYFNSTSQV